MEPYGSGRKVFSCPWHGWNYRTDGTLAGVPDSWGFPDVDKQEYKLDEFEIYETNRRELDMNWKLALDTFGEAYHV